MIMDLASIDRFLSRVDAWANEDSHRGRLVRAFRADMGSQRRELQSRRLLMLSHYVATADTRRMPRVRYAV